MEVRHEQSSCDWPMDAFPDEDCGHPGTPESLQRPSGGFGAAFRRRYRVSVDRPLLSPGELMSIVLADPNVACPLELGRFEREVESPRPMEPGEEMRVRLPGPWNGPVRVIAVTDRSFRLATLRGHMEAGEIEFRAHDEDGRLVFEIESWARSGDRLSNLLYNHLRMAKEVQLHMWTSVLERVVKLAQGRMRGGVDIHTVRVD
jgi:hypothetical protein